MNTDSDRTRRTDCKTQRCREGLTPAVGSDVAVGTLLKPEINPGFGDRRLLHGPVVNRDVAQLVTTVEGKARDGDVRRID